MPNPASKRVALRNEKPAYHRSSMSIEQESGFTLIEIMIALAILGTSLFILLDMHYNAVHVQNRLEKEVEVRNLLSLAVGMSEVEIAAGTLKDAQEFGDRYPGWRYTFDAQPVGDDASKSARVSAAPSFPGLYDVLVTVEDPDRVAHELHYFTVVRTFAGQQGDLEGDQGSGGGAGQPSPGGGNE